jgi:hypothetical protein
MLARATARPRHHSRAMRPPGIGQKWPRELVEAVSPQYALSRSGAGSARGVWPAGSVARSRVPQSCRWGRMQLSISEVTGWAFPAHRAVARDYRDWYRRQISACAESAISHLRSSTECRARTTTAATLAAVQNGTSGVPDPITGAAGRSAAFSRRLYIIKTPAGICWRRIRRPRPACSAIGRPVPSAP